MKKPRTGCPGLLLDDPNIDTTFRTGKFVMVILQIYGGRKPDQPPIDDFLSQLGGSRPAALSDCVRIASSLSNRVCKIAVACCSSERRRSSIGFDCSSRMNS
jgi:hypothetical protein